MRIPGTAEGSTRRRVTCHFVPPAPYPPSRRLVGTARIASAEVMITIGRTRIAIVSPPETTVLPPVRFARGVVVAVGLPTSRTKTARPSRP